MPTDRKLRPAGPVPGLKTICDPNLDPGTIALMREDLDLANFCAHWPCPEKVEHCSLTALR